MVINDGLNCLLSQPVMNVGGCRKILRAKANLIVLARSPIFDEEGCEDFLHLVLKGSHSQYQYGVASNSFRLWGLSNELIGGYIQAAT